MCYYTVIPPNKHVEVSQILSSDPLLIFIDTYVLLMKWYLQKFKCICKSRIHCFIPTLRMCVLRHAAAAAPGRLYFEDKLYWYRW